MRRKNNILFALLLLVHVALAYMYIAQRDICSDEPGYIEYAKRWLHGQPERIDPLDDSKTPLTVIAWLPRIVEQFRHKETRYNDWGRSDQEAGRYMMVLFTILVACYVWQWSRKLLGEKWELLPVMLFLFDPLVLGHSGVIGSDMASAFAYTALLFHLWQYFSTQQRKHIWLVAFFLGLACITKQSMVPMLLIVPLLCFINHIRTTAIRSFFSRSNIAICFISLLIILFAINAAFLFHGSFHPLSAYQFQSGTFIGLQQKLGFLSNIPLPLPGPFIKGFDMVQYHAQIGGGLPESTYNGVFVMGNHYMAHGVWYYYLAVGLFKMPLPVLLLTIGGVFYLMKIVFRKGLTRNAALAVLLLPMLVLLVVLSCFNPFQIGIRHIIFLLPCAYLLLSIYIKKLARERLLLVLLACWQTFSEASYYNNYIAYSNELAFDKTAIVNWISDSSIDYGQNNFFLKKFLQEHPGFSVPDSLPCKGKFAVRALDVLHVNKQLPDRFAWLRSQHPYGNYKGTIWLYDIR